MRILLTVVAMLGLFVSTGAAELKIAVLDFDDATSQSGTLPTGTALNTAKFAQKGALLLNEKLLDADDIILIDRRDFISKIDKATPKSLIGEEERPSFIHAAQLLKADAVLRGSLMSMSSGSRTVDPAKTGRGVAFTKVSIRVSLQALDAVDGAVMAAASGKASREFRQSGAEQTRLGEDDLLDLFEEAIEQAVPKIEKKLAAKFEKRGAREKVHISIAATEDPCLVEIDGVLVGSTPITGLAVYKGDHTMKVSRPTYESISKRMVLNADTDIKVPMVRTGLTAKERKEVLLGAELKMYVTDSKPDFIIQEIK